MINVHDYTKRTFTPFSMFQVKCFFGGLYCVLDVFFHVLSWEYAFFLQILGYALEEVDCIELGVVTKWEIFYAFIDVILKIIVTKVDWRDFFLVFK